MHKYTLTHLSWNDDRRYRKWFIVMKNGNGNQHTRIKLLNGSSLCVCMCLSIWIYVCTIKGCQKCLFMEFVSVFLRKESSSSYSVCRTRRRQNSSYSNLHFLFELVSVLMDKDMSSFSLCKLWKCAQCKNFHANILSTYVLVYKCTCKISFIFHFALKCVIIIIGRCFVSDYIFHTLTSSSASIISVSCTFFCVSCTSVRDQAHLMLNTKGKRGVFMVCICGIYTEKHREV